MITFHPLNTFPGEYKWFMDRNPIVLQAGQQGIVAHDGERIQGMVIMDSWTKNSCQLHVAVDNMLAFRHGLVDEVFGYIFGKAGRGIVYGVTPSNNAKALRLNKHAGLVELYRLKDADSIGVDLVVQELRKEDYYAKKAA